MFSNGDTGLFYISIYALILNSMLTAGYCAVGEFSMLATFYGIAGYTFYFVTVLSLIILHIHKPELKRPYKT